MQNRYDVIPSEDGLSYKFTTRYNIIYQIALFTYVIGDIAVFSLSLYPEDNHAHIDYRVKNTVIKLIADVLVNESNVIFYVCDTEDNKQDKRHEVFEYWYQKAAAEYPFIDKFNYRVKSQNGYFLNSSLLFNINNPLGPYLVEEFKKLLEIS